jgi:DNA topoisomerase VI subunit B
MPPSLTCTTFETSRALEFFTQSELTMQVGFPSHRWVLAILKELIDNALDACESAGIAPVIAVTCTRDSLSVHDNGPGLPAATLERSLDYMVRGSDKTYYTSPSRGQLGNALKCLWAIPYVLTKTYSVAREGEGHIEIATPGMRSHVHVMLNPLLKEPSITLTSDEDSTIKTGTCVTLHIASYLMGFEDADFYHPIRLLQGYALFNPHASFLYHGPHMTSPLSDEEEDEACPPVTRTLPATTPGWQKWVPSWPTSVHWYTPQRFEQLISAYLAADRRAGRVRTVRDLIGEFDGLTGVQVRKEVGIKADLHGATLEALVHQDVLDVPKVRGLLRAMQARARAVKPQALGVLGQAHLQQRLTTVYGVEASTLTYKRAVGVDDGIPYVIEVVVGWHSQERPGYRLYGYNSAPSLATPFPCLHGLLQKYRLAEGDVATIVVHVTCPRLEPTDRGKTSVAIPSAMTHVLANTVRLAAQAWEKLKREDERHDREGQRIREAALRAQRRKTYTVKEAAWEVMEQAYLKASDHGRLPANARQIMYAARPEILRLTGKADALANSAYFTQHLLPDFLNAHPDLTAGWDVAYDARGHFSEPHTSHEVGVGTLEVRRYIYGWAQTIATAVGTTIKAEIRTYGPRHRYAYALFIEKEGFNELLHRADLKNRYDLALMSTKGMSVTAARHLIEALHAEGVTLLMVHDFDKSGLEILQTLFTPTRRYTYKQPPRVVDLGLRLAQAEAMGLESEDVVYHGSKNPCESLRQCGATDEECQFLVGNRSWVTQQWHGKRIELNAMTSQQFLDWLEERLRAVGVTKLVPDEQTLTTAYKHQRRVAALQDVIDKAIQAYDEQHADTLTIPADLAEQVCARITDSSLSWDEGLWQIIRKEHDTNDEQCP